ncbi:MAG TPA: lysylphosphatidylglycerol synthase transmembrane domain-containing protein [Candidatus Nanoarchaeia archaeon]|nr:lysylphosphatidylglycerol synthase transmembrane domain-containing protein [Candidatus Nanoarchaeia archaeon]
MNLIKNYRYLKLAFGIVLFAFLIKWIGFTNILETLKQFDWTLFPLIILFYFAAEMLGAINFYLLARPIKMGISFPKYLRYYFLSWSIGYFVPGKIGEYSIVYFLKDKVSIGKGTMLFVLNKMISFAVVMVIAAFGMFKFFAQVQALKLVAMMVAASVLAIFFILHPAGRGIIRKYILRKYAKKFTGFGASFLGYLRDEKRRIVVNYLLTVAKWVFQTMVVFLAFHSFGSSIEYIDVFLIHAIVSIIGIIPITIAGLGIKEGSAVFLYQFVGEKAVVTADAYIVMLFLFYTVAVTILIYHELAKNKPNRLFHT